MSDIAKGALLGAPLLAYIDADQGGWIFLGYVVGQARGFWCRLLPAYGSKMPEAGRLDNDPRAIQSLRSLAEEYDKAAQSAATDEALQQESNESWPLDDGKRSRGVNS